jgi:hypothetical protein
VCEQDEEVELPGVERSSREAISASFRNRRLLLLDAA